MIFTKSRPLNPWEIQNLSINSQDFSSSGTVILVCLGWKRVQMHPATHQTYMHPKRLILVIFTKYSDPSGAWETPKPFWKMSGLFLCTGHSHFQASLDGYRLLLWMRSFVGRLNVISSPNKRICCVCLSSAVNRMSLELRVLYNSWVFTGYRFQWLK